LPRLTARPRPARKGSGNDLTYRFPLIVETLARLHSRSCIIDGEAVACDDNGVTLFNRVRYRRHDESIFLYAFDLIELNGDDLRRDPLEGRKATLEMILAKVGIGIRFNEHMHGDGETVFRHVCKLGLEGIVSKRKDSRYRSGRSPDWLKMKNADAPAVKREADEDWGKEMIFVPEQRICFGEGASLGFHAARNIQTGELSLSTTQWMVSHYPQNILMWIKTRGGAEKMTIENFWVIYADELWEMGYRKCAPEPRPMPMTIIRHDFPQQGTHIGRFSCDERYTVGC
jgi:bifunctional non-homologous end joining protein LigD